jgi:hypothetical protein
MLDRYEVQIHLQNGGQVSYFTIGLTPDMWLIENLNGNDDEYLTDCDEDGKYFAVKMDFITAVILRKIEPPEEKCP